MAFVGKITLTNKMRRRHTKRVKVNKLFMDWYDKERF